ncbi:CDP-diacylglycerol--glycerol-3-phosphate 3-phosphatidyltransferase [Candidatus Woesearchaeota archaeon]|nr:CDP-diacylglycerol--glycerol-3-phosphate 3-phosphatidyltransferase [Candidatus Woesearchaeota archaeon]|tara:strand:+ start:639 stop:1235 length:597 start_codon:yes stop_codon:yes gene_type:complete
MAHKIWTTPNILTFFRFFLVPIIVVFVLLDKPITLFFAGILFIIASITDWLDGKIAREWGEESTLGIYLDPLVDKILVHSILIVLSLIGLLPFWLVMILLARDIITSAIRSYVSRHKISVRAVKSGKLKMLFQTITISLVFIVSFLGKMGIALNYMDILFILIQMFLITTIVISYIGLVDFFIKNRKILKKTALERYF